jgi:protein phosphatase
MDLAAASKTDVGRKREGNEDNHFLAPELNLFAVCDGMGGHAAGEVASRLAVDTIRESMRKYLSGESVDPVVQAVPRLSPKSNFLINSIQLANQAIYQAAQQRREYAGMGTTVVAALGLGDTIALAHVGDSRIYRIRDNQIVQVSRDHSLVQMQVEKGILTPEEAAVSQYRHMITRALGLRETVEVDLEEHPVLAGDILLLCSDGLSDLVEDEEMLAVVKEAGDDLEKACQLLVDRANFKGGDDNITALLVQARPSDPQQPMRKERPASRLGDTEVRVFPHPQRRRGFFGWLKDLFSG